MKDDNLVNHLWMVDPFVNKLIDFADSKVFSFCLQKTTSLSGDVQYTLRMCVAVKRKLQIFYWKNRDFHELQVSQLYTVSQQKYLNTLDMLLHDANPQIFQKGLSQQQLVEGFC